MQTELGSYMDINAVVIKPEIVDSIRKSAVEIRY